MYFLIGQRKTHERWSCIQLLQFHSVFWALFNVTVYGHNETLPVYVGIVGGKQIHLWIFKWVFYIYTWFSYIRKLFDFNISWLIYDIWSIAAFSPNATCPAFDEGYYQASDIPWVYKTFVPISTNNVTLPKLQTADGNGQCNPFPSLSSKLPQLPQSSWGTCEVQPLANSSDAVCAFVYSKPVTNLSTCINRTYQLQTFSSAAAATSAEAVVTHTRGKWYCERYLLWKWFLFSLIFIHLS